LPIKKALPKVYGPSVCSIFYKFIYIEGIVIISTSYNVEL